MSKIRILPLLLLKNRGLYKGKKFKHHQYVGDPINVIKIFNEKEADELVLLDITASLEKRSPDFKFLKEIASELFMPFSYGGGVRQCDDIKQLFHIGIEKVILNTASHFLPELITEAAKQFGSQSIVVSIDVKKNFWNQYSVYTLSGTHHTRRCPFVWAKEMESRGAGEILLNAIERDGTRRGYDLMLAKKMVEHVSVPIILAGGAASFYDFKLASSIGVSAVAAGSFFVFYGEHNAVLIQYPVRQTEM